MLSRQRRLLIIAALPAIAILITLALPPLPQDPAYHDFADQREMLGVAHFIDVASNLPMLVAGLLGLVFILGQRGSIPNRSFSHVGETIPYGLFFAAVVLTSFGSAYYHLQPDNISLSWDRLPLSLVFISLLAATIAERIDRTVALVLLLPLAILAVNSVIYWSLTEGRGLGDLRPYLVVQFVPIFLIPVIIALFPPRYDRTRDLATVVGIYLVAKICEWGDAAVYSLGQVVSGHSLKHGLAALAIYWVYRMLRQRQAA
jgi:hypothetical protein